MKADSKHDDSGMLASGRAVVDHHYDARTGFAVVGPCKGTVIISDGKDWLCEPAPPADHHPWIIAALVLVIIWMWMLGTFMTWVRITQRAWRNLGFSGVASHRSMMSAWQWKYLAWPLWPFWRFK